MSFTEQYVLRTSPQHKTHTMIQRLILRQSRAFSSRSSFLVRPSTQSPIRLHRVPFQSSEQFIAPRCYSTATEAVNGAEGETSAAEQPTTETKQEEDPLKKELDAKNREVIDLKVHPNRTPLHPPKTSLHSRLPLMMISVQDKYLRSVADFRNLQERTKRDVQAASNFAIQRFAKDLVESIDNLDRALTTVPADKLSPSSPTTTSSPSSSPSSSSSSSSSPPSPSENSNNDLQNLHQGLKMTERILMQTLAKHGLERFDPSDKGDKFDPNLHEAMFMTPVEGKEDGVVFMTQQKGFLLNGRVLRVSQTPRSWRLLRLMCADVVCV